MGRRAKGPGTLFGVGVGPGDPELITLKAVNVLRSVQVVFSAASSDNEYSIALDIVRPHLDGATGEVRRLPFPMTRDRAVLEKAWHDNATQVLERLKGGQDVAFITLGDPLTYSTFAHLLRQLTMMEPGVRVVTVPGITSYHAACARLNLPIAEGREGFQVFSGINSDEDLEKALLHSDTVFVLKAYKNFHRIRAVLERHGLTRGSVLVKRLFLDGEDVVHGIEGIPEDTGMPYLTLLIVKKRGRAVNGR